jgi:hypothetical protein
MNGNVDINVVKRQFEHVLFLLSESKKFKFNFWNKDKNPHVEFEIAMTSFMFDITRGIFNKDKKLSETQQQDVYSFLSELFNDSRYDELFEKFPNENMTEYANYSMKSFRRDDTFFNDNPFYLNIFNLIVDKIVRMNYETKTYFIEQIVECMNSRLSISKKQNSLFGNITRKVLSSFTLDEFSQIHGNVILKIIKDAIDLNIKSNSIDNNSILEPNRDALKDCYRIREVLLTKSFFKNNIILCAMKDMVYIDVNVTKSLISEYLEYYIIVLDKYDYVNQYVNIKIKIMDTFLNDLEELMDLHGNMTKEDMILYKSMRKYIAMTNSEHIIEAYEKNLIEQ